MQTSWLERFQLFLFDFDGLLVDTETLHFHAFLKMCKDRGYECFWTFEQYCKAAHTSRDGLKKATYQEFPELFKEEPRWEVLYEERKKAYLQILESEMIELMPGVERCLRLLEERNLLRCVVTNSRKKEVDKVRDKIPLLQSIPHWVTREDYAEPKPHPEPYLTAMQRLGVNNAIGFEDTLRGFKALESAGAKPVLIAPTTFPGVETHFHSFDDLFNNGL